jgi:predicted dehydrogenase
MRVVVLGGGSIGKRHDASLQALGCETLVTGRGGLDEAAAWGADAVVIATPTSAHADGLRWAVEQGLHAYVEKPLAASSDGIAELLDEAAAAGLVVGVGYNLRFHPALEAIREAVLGGRVGRLLSVRAEVGQYLPDWHPGEDYRGSYAARRELGGGALLTLSHELDYVRWIGGEIESVSGVAARVSALELDVDDVAELVCRHESGALSSVHADFLDRSYNRACRWAGEEGTLAWRWDRGVELLPAGETLWSDPGFDFDETYRRALADFLESARIGGRPRADGHDGLRVLELCEAVAR